MHADTHVLGSEQNPGHRIRPIICTSRLTITETLLISKCGGAAAENGASKAQAKMAQLGRTLHRLCMLLLIQADKCWMR